MIKQYKQKQQMAQPVQQVTSSTSAAFPVMEEKIITADCVLRKLIHGGNIEAGYTTLAGIIADEAGRGYSFVQSIPFNSGECIIVFRK